jgi:YD repeat-containing protein
VSGGSRTDTRYRRLSGDDPYRVGLVDQVTSTSYPNAGDLSRSATRVLERELDPATNQTVSETIFNVSGGRDSTITFLRDTSSMGQVTRIEVAGFEPSGFEDTSWTPFSRTVDIGYDGEWIYPRTATNGLGLVEETWIHPLLGVEMEHVTAAGDRTTSTYDGFGRLVSQQASTGSGVDVTYSPSELGWMDVLVEGTDGSTSFSTLDVLGREISSGQELMNAGIPRSSEVTRQYDHFGRLTRIYNPRFDGVPLDGTPYVEMEYDNIDRPAVMYAQDRTYMQWIYTGRRTTQRDFRGNSTRTILDPELRVQSTVEGAGGLRTDYEYGFFGEVERVTAGGQVWEYDTAGSFQLPEATVDPDAGRREYLFNTPRRDPGRA